MFVERAVAPVGRTREAVGLVKLNLGCGLNAPDGWQNLDSSLSPHLARIPGVWRVLRVLRFINAKQFSTRWPTRVKYCNLEKPLPFETGSVDAVYSSHVLEHLEHGAAQRLVGECHRVLKIGGLLRMVVPDLRVHVIEYLEKNSGSAADDFMRSLGVIAERGGRNCLVSFLKSLRDKNLHSWMYDEHSLRELLGAAGFCDIVRSACGESAIPGVGDVDRPERFVDSLCLESRK